MFAKRAVQTHEFAHPARGRDTLSQAGAVEVDHDRPWLGAVLGYEKVARMQVGVNTSAVVKLPHGKRHRTGGCHENLSRG